MDISDPAAAPKSLNSFTESSHDRPAVPEDFGNLRARLARVVRRWVRCVHVAEDIASEAVARAWQWFTQPTSWRTLLAWTVRAARRLIADEYRDSARSKLATDIDVALLAGRSTQEQVDVDDGLAHASLSLDPHQRSVLALLIIGGTTREVADALRLTPRGATKLVAQTRSALRQVWNYSRSVPS